MKIIINSDDYGFTKSTNMAVKELAQLGTLSSTTVMVNMPYANEVNELENINNLGIGLHFNLTQGKPISNPLQIQSLVNKKGSFYNVHEFNKRIKEKKIHTDDILTELNAQYTLLQHLTKKKISHIDSHQDINKNRMIKNVLIKYSQESKISIGLRWYNKTYINNINNKYALIEPTIKNIKKFGVKRIITEAYFKMQRVKILQSFKLTDGMIFTLDHNMRSLLNNIIYAHEGISDNKIYEVMVHPAISIKDLYDTRMLNERVEEYEILKSPQFRKYVKHNKLINYNNI